MTNISMKKLTTALIASLLLCSLGPIIAPVNAQTNDASQAALLPSNELTGCEEPKGQSHYYKFSAGPGDLNLKVAGATDFYSTNLKVVIRDLKQRELANITFPANSDNSEKSVSIHLPASQNLTMQLMFSLDVGVHLNYKIKLDGPINSDKDSMLASADAKSGGAKSEQNTATLQQTNASTSSAKLALVTTSSEDKTVLPNSNDRPIDDKWAVIIGVSKFEKPEIALKYSSKDAKDLRDYLITEANFAPDHVKLIVDEDATKAHVLAEIGDKWLPRLAHPNDLVLIFVSSHGSPSSADLEGLNYLVMHDTDPNSLYATGLPLQDLAAAIRQRVHADRVILIVDACHSGAANPAKGLTRIGNFDSDAIATGTGQLVICSSEPSQVSWESKRYSNGVFTHQLIEALRSRGGKISLGDAFNQMKDSVQTEVLKDRGELQSPVLKSKWNGRDLILSTPPAHPHAVPNDLRLQ